MPILARGFRPSTHLSYLVEERALRPDEERDTVSLETLDIGGSHLSALIEQDFAAFIRLLSKLSGEDQELLLGYYVLRTPQRYLCRLHASTQTLTSTRIRNAVKRLAFQILVPEVTAETLRPILEQAGLEHILPIPTSELLEYYIQNHDYDELAELCEVPRSKVRIALHSARQQLLKSRNEIEQALGAYLDARLQWGEGPRAQKKAEMVAADIYIRHPEVLGRFRVDVSDPDFENLFVPQAEEAADEAAPGYEHKQAVEF